MSRVTAVTHVNVTKDIELMRLAMITDHEYGGDLF